MNEMYFFFGLCFFEWENDLLDVGPRYFSIQKVNKSKLCLEGWQTSAHLRSERSREDFHTDVVQGSPAMHHGELTMCACSHFSQRLVLPWQNVISMYGTSTQSEAKSPAAASNVQAANC